MDELYEYEESLNQWMQQQLQDEEQYLEEMANGNNDFSNG